MVFEIIVFIFNFILISKLLNRFRRFQVYFLQLRSFIQNFKIALIFSPIPRKKETGFSLFPEKNNAELI